MRISCDKNERKAILKATGIDTRAAKALFKGPTLTGPGSQMPDGTPTFISLGKLAGRAALVRWAEDGKARRVIGMRKANGEEQAGYEERFR